MTIRSHANFAVQRVLDDLVAQGREVGVQLAAYRHGKLPVDAWAGLADPDSGRQVDGDTLFNVYSVTKAVAATALHIQAKRRFVDYDTPVALYWPEYAVNGRDAITVRDALSHRTGGRRDAAGSDICFDLRLGRDGRRIAAFERHWGLPDARCL